MMDLKKLVNKYEDSFALSEAPAFAKLLNRSSQEISTLFTSRKAQYNALLLYAESRIQTGKNGELYAEELQEAISAMKPHGYSIPDQISQDAVKALEDVVAQRILFYQDLLSTPGEFNGWQELFKEKYKTGETYLSAINNLVLAEHNLEQYQDEIARAPEAVSLKIVTKQNQAKSIARQYIIREFSYN